MLHQPRQVREAQVDDLDPAVPDQAENVADRIRHAGCLLRIRGELPRGLPRSGDDASNGGLPPGCRSVSRPLRGRAYEALRSFASTLAQLQRLLGLPGEREVAAPSRTAAVQRAGAEGLLDTAADRLQIEADALQRLGLRGAQTCDPADLRALIGKRPHVQVIAV